MEKSIKYTFFYLIETEELWAYSEEKKLIKGFQHTRDMTKFYKKEVPMTSEDLAILHEEEHSKRLMSYKFEIGEYILELPITMIEKLTIERAGNQAAFIGIYASACLPLEIFTKDMQEALCNIGYKEAHEGWVNGNTDSYQPDMLNTFLHYYGDLLNLNDIGGDKK